MPFPTSDYKHKPVRHSIQFKQLIYVAYLLNFMTAQ